MFLSSWKQMQLFIREFYLKICKIMVPRKVQNNNSFTVIKNLCCDLCMTELIIKCYIYP